MKYLGEYPPPPPPDYHHHVSSWLPSSLTTQNQRHDSGCSESCLSQVVAFHPARSRWDLMRDVSPHKEVPGSFAYTHLRGQDRNAPFLTSCVETGEPFKTCLCYHIHLGTCSQFRVCANTTEHFGGAYVQALHCGHHMAQRRCQTQLCRTDDKRNIDSFGTNSTSD